MKEPNLDKLQQEHDALMARLTEQSSEEYYCDGRDHVEIEEDEE